MDDEDVNLEARSGDYDRRSTLARWGVPGRDNRLTSQVDVRAIPAYKAGYQIVMFI